MICKQLHIWPTEVGTFANEIFKCEQSGFDAYGKFYICTHSYPTTLLPESDCGPVRVSASSTTENLLKTGGKKEKNQYKSLIMNHIHPSSTLLFAALFIAAAQLTAQTQPRRLTKLPSQLIEVSGMVAASADSIWMLNDGGNPPTLYRTNVHGRLQSTKPLSLPNTDWEELTSDHAGHLFIADIGNNDNRRRDLAIYRLRIKDQHIDTIRFRYPDQLAFPPASHNAMDFDCEAMVWHNGILHLFTKMHWGASEFVAGHYTLEDKPGDQIATKVGKLILDKQVITGAALSPDNQQLALTSYLYRKRGKIYLGKSYLTIYSWPDLLAGRERVLYKRRLRGWITARQVESISYWDQRTVLIASEKTPVQKQKMKRVRVRVRQ
jgi:hypothetical protein